KRDAADRHDAESGHGTRAGDSVASCPTEKPERGEDRTTRREGSVESTRGQTARGTVPAQGSRHTTSYKASIAAAGPQITRAAAQGHQRHRRPYQDRAQEPGRRPAR